MFDRPTRLFLRWRDRGDAAALAELFDRTAPDSLRLVLHLCRHAVDAEDVLQATFLAAIESAARFERNQPAAAGGEQQVAGDAAQERRRSMRQFAALLAAREAHEGVLHQVIGLVRIGAEQTQVAPHHVLVRADPVGELEGGWGPERAGRLAGRRVRRLGQRHVEDRCRRGPVRGQADGEGSALP